MLYAKPVRVDISVTVELHIVPLLILSQNKSSMGRTRQLKRILRRCLLFPMKPGQTDYEPRHLAETWQVREGKLVTSLNPKAFSNSKLRTSCFAVSFRSDAA